MIWPPFAPRNGRQQENENYTAEEMLSPVPYISKTYNKPQSSAVGRGVGGGAGPGYQAWLFPAPRTLS